MKKLVISILLIIFVSTTFILAEKVATFTEVNKPDEITIDDYIFVQERTTIYVYDRKSYKLIKKFGKEGEGPREFKRFVFIIAQKNHLLINSIGKVSFFTKQGEFIKEIRVKEAGRNRIFWPVNDGFIGQGRVIENKIRYLTVYLYDHDLRRVKEIYRCQDFIQQQGGGKIFWPPYQPRYFSYKNQVYIAGKPGFIIDAMTPTGEKLFTIERKDYQKRKFTAKDKKEHQEFLQRSYKEQYEQLKSIIVFTDYFPEILELNMDNDKLYVTTWKFDKGKFETFEYDKNGKFLRKFFIQVALMEGIEPYPMRVKDGLLYQLIENEDENWDLHITSLDE